MIRILLRISTYIPLVLPHTLDDRIEHIAKVSALMYLLADVHNYMSDEDKEAMQALFKHLPAFTLGTQTPAPDDRLGWIVADILSHFRSDENLSEEASYLGKKACEHIIGLFSASTSSKHVMITIEYPTMKSYLAHRFRDAGMLWSFSHIRWRCDIFIPDSIMDDPNFIELESYISKRSKEGSVSGIVNSIPIVMQERGLNQVDATRYVEDIIRQVEHDILEVEGKIVGSANGTPKL
ncbi:isoprenoid synthase domain-containing protein [Crucibulum laeve]|uniref:Isoprenoid synthase domain-containing protein n=1 Tax=Crucibulum laeve TaxID=68775 RepID=A0A5C3LV66_9AGAR|nr:isoprenoid synthase domain-containing protein [Crucibulum laeve]